MGARRGSIDHALAAGRIVAVHRGVYAVGHLALAPYATLLAAVLAVGDGAVLDRRPAGEVWEMLPPTDCVEGRPVSVTVLGRDAGRRRRGIVVHRTTELPPDDVSVRYGIPITSPARTLLDLAPEIGRRELERAFDRGLKARVLRRGDVAKLVARSPGRPGASLLGALAAGELRSAGETRSEREERLLKLIRQGGLPTPRTNARIGPYTVDALWPAERLVVEVDGYEFHSTRWSFESDHERDIELGAAGYTVLRFTSEQLETQPAVVLVRLAQRLASLAAQSSRIVS